MENIEIYIAGIVYASLFIALIVLIVKRIREGKHEHFDKRSN